MRYWLLSLLAVTFSMPTHSHSENAVPDQVRLALYYCATVDALGSGIEMKSREYLLSQWERVRTELIYERTAPYNIGLAKGWYSDDTEMSIGVIRALRAHRKLTPDLVATEFFTVYDNFKHENNGIGRGGYGGVGSLLKLENADRATLLAEYRRQQLSAPLLPGNGSTMRILPLLLYAKNEAPLNHDLLPHNIAAQTLTTHNHVLPLLCGLIYIDTANALLDETIDFPDAIAYAIDYLESSGRYPHALAPIDSCRDKIHSLAAEWQIPIAGDWTSSINEMSARLITIDALPDPVNAPLDDFIAQILVENAPQIKGGIGLTGRAHHTLYTTLYCWKHTLADWNTTNSKSTEERYLSLMLRCIEFAGDTDTLLVHVMPVTLMRLDRQIPVKLPDWVANACVELDQLDRRIRE